MSFDETLAARCREVLAGNKGVTERKMFGGLCFMLYGNMIGGVLKDHLVLRLGVSEAYARALRAPHVRPMDFTGRPMPGMLYVDPPGLVGTRLQKWLAEAVAFGRSLPKKAPARPKAARTSKAKPAAKGTARAKRRGRSKNA